MYVGQRNYVTMETYPDFQYFETIPVLSFSSGSLARYSMNLLLLVVILFLWMSDEEV